MMCCCVFLFRFQKIDAILNFFTFRCYLFLFSKWLWKKNLFPVLPNSTLVNVNRLGPRMANGIHIKFFFCLFLPIYLAACTRYLTGRHRWLVFGHRWLVLASFCDIAIFDRLFVS